MINNDLTKDTVLFAISCDTLMLMNSQSEIDTVLIEGESKEGLVCTISAKEFDELYTSCLEVRKLKTLLKINTQYGVIFFK